MHSLLHAEEDYRQVRQRNEAKKYNILEHDIQYLVFHFSQCDIPPILRYMVGQCYEPLR
jgi:hypothetical protein